jgi:sulfatase maturation enzyme AslB (radical SAM superfamily)
MRQIVHVQNLFLNVSLSCDMKCRRCYGHLDTSPKNMMDMDTAVKATESYTRHRDTQYPSGYIMLFGGEPLLNRKLVENYIPWAREKYPFLDLSLFTNGAKLDRKKIDFFIANRTSLFISLDGDFKRHSSTRGITAKTFSHIISMIKLFNEKEPGKIIPYCVVSKENLDSFDRDISFIASLGVKNIAVAKDFKEDWTPEDRTTLVGILKNYRDIDFMIYPEATSNCLNCTPRQMMVYPDGKVYDLCYVCGTVLAGRNLMDKKDLELFYMGNVHENDSLYMDTGKKMETMHSLVFCPTLTADYSTLDRLSWNMTNIKN